MGRSCQVAHKPCIATTRCRNQAYAKIIATKLAIDASKQYARPQGVNNNNGLQTKAITIISEDKLANASREKIETVLFSSGHTGAVVFVDRNGISLMEVNESN